MNLLILQNLICSLTDGNRAILAAIDKNYELTDQNNGTRNLPQIDIHSSAIRDELKQHVAGFTDLEYVHRST